ncbi:dynamin family protein [Nocardioides massiliensis]|uniref:ABC transporter n=1 Tax=Nocardioides massiliensis TaxID=1325935 RepID=A0ABT9NPH6_9ACTN|nr:dynamin family protein [Nocardioides massiliensis]MDP9822310.1 hypothetical protein [Nocardioides massiliensis]
MTATNATTDMLTALVRLREVLRKAPLPLETPGIAAHRSVRTEVLAQLEDYVLPRLIQIDAPLLTVVGGSTGAGKSTLVNSLVGGRVSLPGVLRPTTRSPVLVHHPSDVAWFDQSRILPDLERTPDASMDTGRLQLVASDNVPPGLAILDAPDIDSVEERNRLLASQLLAAADLWLFVTSAARYADQVPWEFLKSAAERSTAVAVVLDRTPPDALAEVSGHLARMLTARGLRDSPLFAVPESTVDDEGLLPPEAVADIRAWLEMLAADAGARAAVVRQTLDGAIRSLSRRTHPLADALAEQATVVTRLREAVDTAYDAAQRDIDEAITSGNLLRGEVLMRWQEFVGTGDLLKALESRVSQLRDRVVGGIRGRTQQIERVAVAVESGLESLILEHAERAAENADRAWRGSDAGVALSDSVPSELGRASRTLRRRVDAEVRAWHEGVLELVRAEGAGKRGTARFLAFGVNGLGVSLMMVVFASTGGVTGAEVGVAGGTAAVAQKVLEAVFGDQAVRRLAERARRDLERRVGALLDEERARFDTVLDELGVDTTAAERLRDATRRVDDVRFAAPEGGYA